ncbi:MAG: hypothetical protein PVJ38_06810 [Candidatus Bathyarchaeota archaeon]
MHQKEDIGPTPICQGFELSRWGLRDVVLIVGSVVTLFAVVLGVPYNWPDNIHVRYGFPLTWGVHTLSTIMGPVDEWNVNVTALVLDLFLWLSLTVISQVVLRFKK